MGIRKSKERGEWAELTFMAKAAALGLKPSKPWGDSAPYDVTIEHGGHFLRVQVKSTCFQPRRKRARAARPYMLAVRHASRRYRVTDFDILAVYIIPRDLWYIIPAAAATPRAYIQIWPGHPSNSWEQYREAWQLFRENPSSADPLPNCHPDPEPAEGEGPASHQNCHPERTGAPDAPGVGATGWGSEGSAKRGTHGVEEPALSLPKGPLPAPEPPPAAPPAPQSPMERMMTQWAQRVNALYHRKP